MKKTIALLLTLCMALSLAACGTPKSGKGDDPKSEGVMTYAQYMDAEVDDKVVIEAFVQGKQSWWENKATVYAQDADGGYLIYNMDCSENDYAKLTTGTKIKVTGYKAEWSGEIEIAEGATFEILSDSTFIAVPTDVTASLGSDDLIKYQNQLVAFNGLTVEANDNGSAYMYNWDGSGKEGDDLYFNASLNGKTYTFTVESYLCDANSDVYKAVKNLKVGDTIDMEGFLYWYESSNPHITSVTVK